MAWIYNINSCSMLYSHQQSSITGPTIDYIEPTPLHLFCRCYLIVNVERLNSCTNQFTCHEDTLWAGGPCLWSGSGCLQEYSRRVGSLHTAVGTQPHCQTTFRSSKKRRSFRKFVPLRNMGPGTLQRPSPFSTTVKYERTVNSNHWFHLNYLHVSQCF